MNNNMMNCQGLIKLSQSRSADWIVQYSTYLLLLLVIPQNTSIVIVYCSSIKSSSSSQSQVV